jgi:hypothetical protein
MLYYKTLNSAWESLPDMSDSRSDHACEKIKRNGRDYLVVMGGAKGGSSATTDTIEFYDLTTRPNSWETIAGTRLPQTTSKIFGWKILKFDVAICEVFLINWQGTGFTCTGNYSWTFGTVPGYIYSKFYLPAVDANLFGGETV